MARELGEGVFTVTPTKGFAWSVLLTHAGASVVLHRAWEYRNVPGLDLASLPGGATWRAAIEAIPERERHLRTHEGHLTFLNELDGPVITGDMIKAFTFTGEADTLRARLTELAARGVTEIAYQPKGPDIARELRAFAAMAGLA